MNRRFFLAGAGALATLPAPIAAAAVPPRGTVGGIRRIDPALDATNALPDASEAWRLPPGLAALPPRPLYGRAPDAKVAGA